MDYFITIESSKDGVLVQIPCKKFHLVIEENREVHTHIRGFDTAEVAGLITGLSDVYRMNLANDFNEIDHELPGES